MFKHPRPILIVDDDVELVTLLVDYLQLEGFAPVAAHNGTEALELLSRQEFEIVVLDVMTVSYTHLTLPTTPYV